LQKRPTGSWVDGQFSVRTYFENGLPKTLANRNGAGTTVEQHALSYLAGGLNLNGNRAPDVLQLKGPVSTAACYAATCTQSWSYDARERVTTRTRVRARRRTSRSACRGTSPRRWRRPRDGCRHGFAGEDLLGRGLECFGVLAFEVLAEVLVDAGDVVGPHHVDLVVPFLGDHHVYATAILG